jgi:hypothetical protein
MDDKMKHIRKECKTSSIFLGIVIAIMAVFLTAYIVDLFSSATKSKESYNTKYTDEDTFGNKQYYLYVDGVQKEPVDINEYGRLDENGDTNYKYCYLIECVTYIVSIILVMGIFITLLIMLHDVTKVGKPFNMKNVRLMQLISILVMIFAVTPGMVKLTFTFILFLNAEWRISGTHLFILLFGFAIGVIAEMFKYGYKLQDDMDLIA